MQRQKLLWILLGLAAIGAVVPMAAFVLLPGHPRSGAKRVSEGDSPIFVERKLGQSPSPGAASRDVEEPAAEIDPALVQFVQTADIPAGLHDVRALAVGPDDHIYIGGDRAIRRFSPDGKPQGDIALESEPKCLAVGGADHANPGRIYVGMEEHVEVFDASREGDSPIFAAQKSGQSPMQKSGQPPAYARVAAWKTLGKTAALTSIAAADRDVFVADAGNRIVWHYDVSGELKGRIGDADTGRRIPGFLITSHCFDLGLGADGLLYVVNPRALRLEGYTFSGDLETSWGRGSPEVDGFFGCCNPAQFAVLPDGRFVTAEKGAPRIKIYSAQGKFECVVAGPGAMRGTPADLAADHRGRILVLDASSASVRVFERKKETMGGER